MTDESPKEEPETPKEAPETPKEAPESPKEELETPKEEPETPKEEPETPKEAPETPKGEPESPKEAPEKKERRPIPWALIRFLVTILIIVVGAWAALSFGFVDRYAPQLKHGWSILINDKDVDHSKHQSVTYTCPMHPQILSDEPGECPICGMDLVLVETESPNSADTPTTYTCPMHPQILRDQPGECPICGMTLVPVEMEAEEHDGMDMDMPDSRPNEVSIEPQMLNNLGVRTETVKVRSLSRDVRFTGEVAVDDSTTEVLQSWVAGRIEKVHVDAVGDEIVKGEQIVKIYSPQLLTTSEELVSAIEYAEELKERDALPQSILDAESMVEATEKRLRLWGLRPEQIERIKKSREAETDVMIYATASGTVHKKMVYEGQYVKEGTPLYELIDFGELWVYLNVFENDLGYVYQGMPVEFTTPAFQNRAFYGQVSKIEPMMDAKSRTGRVRVAISNPGERLIPGMYVESEIQIPISSGRPTVSNLAVIRTGERDLVIVARGGGKFYPQEVTLGRLADGYYPILSGLEVGQEVVSQASFLIDSESQLKAALQQMKDGGAVPGGHQH